MAIPSSLREVALADLRRPHPFAFERVGFFTATAGALADGVVLLPFDYIVVPDDGYMPDEEFGALLNAGAFRLARQRARSQRVSVVHVHLHEHTGLPGFSSIDRRETDHFMPDFLKVRPDLPHAALVFSDDRATARCWTSVSPDAFDVQEVVFVGPHLLKSTHA